MRTLLKNATWTFFEAAYHEFYFKKQYLQLSNFCVPYILKTIILET